MADSAISGLPAASSATGSLELGCNDAGTSKKVTDTQLAQLAETRYRQGVMCSHTGDQTISTNSWTTLAMAQEIFKVGDTAIHNTVTNNSRLTAQIAGEYAFSGMVQWEALAADLALQARVYLNVTTVVWQMALPSINDASVSTITQLAGHVSLSASDYIELQVWHDRGGSLTVDVLTAVRFGMYLAGR